MATCVREEKKAPENRQRKRERERGEAEKVGVTPGVTVGSLILFRDALIGLTQALPKRRQLHRQGSPRTVKVRCCCRCFVIGCKCNVAAIRGENRVARGWQYTKPSLASAPLRVAHVHVCAMHSLHL